MSIITFGFDIILLRFSNFLIFLFLSTRILRGRNQFPLSRSAYRYTRPAAEYNRPSAREISGRVDEIFTYIVGTATVPTHTRRSGSPTFFFRLPRYTYVINYVFIRFFGCVLAPPPSQPKRSYIVITHNIQNA